ncbi:MAG TPA: class I adenylate-forming enzyme family protein [Stellaceae bacterium]|nr:class I adenylate-forming enzyme family protein [Stellaceae bacterium]
MSDVFAGHNLAVPYRPLGEILAFYRARDPDKAAIVDLDQESAITFGALDQAVTDIAHHLRGLGVGPGDRVLLLADERLEKLLLWFGIWRLGATVCPLNIELNAQHMAELTASIAPKLVVLEKGLDRDTLVGGSTAPCIRFGTYSADPKRPDSGDEFFAAMPRGGNGGALGERNAAGDMAAIICTSGTTAKPKLVVLDHAFYWLSGLSTIDIVGLTDRDRILEYRSFGWESPQILTLMPFLETGATLHIARRFSHSRFFEWIARHDITFAAGVPTVVNMLLNTPLGFTAADIPSLRCMTCSTAPLTGDQWRRFETMYGITLLQLYGMSEAGWVCGNRHDDRHIGTVGRPALHQEFAIVDGDGRPCPAGIEGEVTCGGPQTALGYLRADGMLDPIRGTRFKTGDLAVMTEDGFVTVTGRTKDLIIRGGVNISPLEVDAVLLAHPGLGEAAAVGVPDPIYGEEVVCYVVPKDGSGLDEAAVLGWCASRLPLPKRPKHAVLIAELPKNDRGKVRRDALREDWTRRGGVTA